MKRFLFLILTLIAAWPANGACPTQSGVACQTFQNFSHIIKLAASGNDVTDTANFTAALTACGPGVSISFTGVMQILPPGLGDPPPGCEISGHDTDPYEGGAGAAGASLLQAVLFGTWPAGSAVIGSNDGVTLQHFTINGNYSDAGNCVNVHNVQGFTALYVHVYQCMIGWNVYSDGTDASHSQRYSKDIQIWNGESMRNGIAGVQIQAVNGGSNTDIQLINDTYSQNGISPSINCTLTEPGNIVALAGTTGLINIGSRNEDVFCLGNRSWDIENAHNVTILGVQTDLTDDISLYLNNSSNIAIVGTAETRSNINGPGNSAGNLGPFVQIAGTVDKLVSFGNFWAMSGGGCVFTAAGSTVTNTALYEQPYGSGAFCDGATLTILAPFFVSNDRSFP